MKTSSNQSKGQRGALLSEINVTPFVDVMLVLLIIFMVTAPMLKQGINISLPQTKKTQGVKIQKDPFILQIKKDQKIYIGDQSVPLENLKEKLSALFEHKTSKSVYLQADRRISYGTVAQVLGEIKSSGISNVSLITIAK
ncbi:MAG: protein TolR [Oligoflexia bacterium]|nr:protein TolR [Oligoflexia bacterium]